MATILLQPIIFFNIRLQLNVNVNTTHLTWSSICWSSCSTQGDTQSLRSGVPLHPLALQNQWAVPGNNHITSYVLITSHKQCRELFKFKNEWMNEWNNEGRKEGNVLFNDALNTFYLWLYGVRHMVKDTQIVREETCCCHMGYYFRIAARFFYMDHPTDRITHNTTFVTHVMEHWLEREIALTTELHLAPNCIWRKIYYN